MEDMKLHQRIKKARSYAGLSQKQLADRVGIAQASISELERGIAKKTSHAVKIASTCGVSPLWLSEGVGEMLAQASGQGDELVISGELNPWCEDTPLDQDDIELPLYREVELAAGDGRTQVIENNGPKLRFSKRTLRSAGVEPAMAAVAYISGTSMEPALMDGSVVGINKQDTQVKDGKVYAIDHDGMLRIKQIFRLPGGGIRLHSFSDDEFPDEDYEAGWPTYIRVIGRIFWSSTMW